MDAEAALRFVDELLSQQGKRLNDLQRFIFLGAWDGKDYQAIHREHEIRCSLDHLKRNVAYQLWKLLSEVLSEKVSKSTVQNCVYRAQQKQQKHQANGTPIITDPQPNPLLQEPERSPDDLPITTIDLTNSLILPTFHPDEDWGDAPATHPFYGYANLLNHLNHAVRVSLCRLISLYGISGVGKTAIALQLALQVRDQFEFVIWRSLKQAPLLPHLLADLTHHFSGQQERSGDLNRFMQYMTEHRCLVILDGLEAVLGSAVHDGSYQAGYEAYGELLRQVGTTAHESCLIVTGWENPREIGETEGNHGHVHSEVIKGLGTSGTQELLIDKRCSGTDYQWREITHRYWGHPLILSAIATNIREFCRGDTAWFLEQFSDPLIPEEMHAQLERQLRRLSEAEQSIVRYLQIQGQPVSFPELQQALGQQMPLMELMKVLRSLHRRALVESTISGDYALQSLIMEYLQKS